MSADSSLMFQITFTKINHSYTIHKPMKINPLTTLLAVAFALSFVSCSSTNSLSTLGSPEYSEGTSRIDTSLFGDDKGSGSRDQDYGYETLRAAEREAEAEGPAVVAAMKRHPEYQKSKNLQRQGLPLPGSAADLVSKGQDSGLDYEEDWSSSEVESYEGDLPSYSDSFDDEYEDYGEESSTGGKKWRWMGLIPGAEHGLSWLFYGDGEGLDQGEGRPRKKVRIFPGPTYAGAPYRGPGFPVRIVRGQRGYLRNGVFVPLHPSQRGTYRIIPGRYGTFIYFHTR